MYLNQNQATKPRINTPWGVADYSEQVSDGIFFHMTPSHGGYKVEDRLNKQIPDYMRKGDGWYEEDCEWSKVAVVFPQAFQRQQRELAKETFGYWYPGEYELYYGEAPKKHRYSA